MLNYNIPGDIKAAVKLLENDSTSIVIGGGTIGVPKIANGDSNMTELIDISRLGLDDITTDKDSVTIGACAKISQLMNHNELAFLHPAAKSIGGPAIRNLATAGGNIFYKGDLVAALLALDAEVVLQSKTGASSISLSEFYSSSDVSNVILTDIKFSLPTGATFGFSKLSRRALNSATVVTAAICGAKSGEALIGLVGASEQPQLLRVDAGILDKDYPASELNELIVTLTSDWNPPTDYHATGKYRKQMIPVAVRRAIAAAVAV